MHYTCVMHKSIPLFLFGLFPALCLSAEQEQDLPPNKNWVDSAHTYTYESVDRLADWMDSFFGTPRAGLEGAS